MHHQLKLLNGGFNRAVHLAFFRKGAFAFRRSIDRATGDSVDQLFDDANGLFDLFNTDQVAGVAVAGRGDGDIKLHGLRALAIPIVGIAEVWTVLAEVASNARSASQGAAQSPVDGFLFGHHADALQSVDEDPVAVQHGFQIPNRLGQTFVDEVFDHGLERLFAREIVLESADPRVVRVEALTGNEIKNVVDKLAFVEPVDERGDPAQVEGGRTHAQKVVLDAPQLAQNGADGFATRGAVDVEQRLHRGVPGNVIDDGGDVVHPADRADVLVPVVMLTQLLKPRVQVANVRRGSGDAFTIQFQHHTEGGVGGGVLGA